MLFSNWLISEMAYILNPNGLELFGKIVQNIDLRFEDYPEIIRNRISNSHPLRYAAKLPNGKYLVQPDGTFHSNKIEFKDRPPKNIVLLPDDWLDYAVVIFEDGTIKPSKKTVGYQPLKFSSLSVQK